MYINKEIVARVIQNARRKAKLTQAELAEKVGISEKHLSKIETGKNYPALNNFLKIVEVLGLSFNDFGLTEEIKYSKQKENLYKVINTSSNNQLDLYTDIINALQKHF